MAEAVLERLTAKNVFDFKGIVAVVTGGGTGIGLMISSTLVANGADVYIIGPKQEDLDKVTKVYTDAAKANAGMGRMFGIEGDISQKSDTERLADEVAKRAGHVTVLFNNAGIADGFAKQPEEATASAFKKALFDPLTTEQFNRVYDTNVVGQYWMTFAFLPLLEKWKNSTEPAAKKFVPQVVMTSSMNGWTKDFNTAGHCVPYIFSKYAIARATSTLARELLPLGIRVNAIAPGLFPTEMTSPGTMNALGQSERQTSGRDSSLVRPSEPYGTDRDVGCVAIMLLANWFINGETVLVDGGSFLVHPSSY